MVRLDCAVGVEFSPFFLFKTRSFGLLVVVDLDGWWRMTEGWGYGGCGKPQKPPNRSGRRNGMAEGNKIYQIALKFCLHGILSLNRAQVSPFYYIDYGKDN